MKKRLLLLFLVLALCMALLSVTAFAADNYQLTVCGVSVTSDNASNVLAGTANGGKVSFNPEGRILTLNGAALSYNGDYGIQSLFSLTINLVGENSLTVTKAMLGIATNDDLTIQGNGSLHVDFSGDSGSGISIGIAAGAPDYPHSPNLTIQGDANVTVTTHDLELEVSNLHYGIYCSGKLTVTGANTSLTATTGNVSRSFGQGVYNRGIYAKSMEVTAGAAVSAASGNANASNGGTIISYGIQTDSGLTLTNATLTVAHGTGSDTQSIYGSVTSNGGNTLCASDAAALQKILNAANADGTDTVKLTNNVITNSTLSVSTKATLDLNGYKLIRTRGADEESTGDALAVSGEGELTVKSSKTGGKIDGPQSTGEKLKVEQSAAITGGHTHSFDSLTDLKCDCGSYECTASGKHDIENGKCKVCGYQFPVVATTGDDVVAAGNMLESVAPVIIESAAPAGGRKISLYANVTEKAADTSIELKNTTSDSRNVTLDMNGHTLNLNGRTLKLVGGTNANYLLELTNGTLKGQILVSTEGCLRLSNDATLKAPNASTPTIRLDTAATFKSRPVGLDEGASIQGGIDTTGTSWTIDQFPVSDSMLVKVGSTETPVAALNLKTLPHGTYEVKAHTEHTFASGDAVCRICGKPNKLNNQYQDTNFWKATEKNTSDPDKSTYDKNSSFTISSKEELWAFTLRVFNGRDFSGKTVTLTADLDLTGYAWMPIGRKRNSAYVFKGTFDGGNHTIKGLTIDTAHQDNDAYPNYGYAGLFAYTSDATIKNLRVEGSVSGTVVDGNGVAGGLVGYAERTEFENCAFVGTVTGDSVLAVGGLVGKSDVSNIHRCYAKATVAQTGKVSMLRLGALIGTQEVGSVNDSYWLQTTDVSGIGKKNKDTGAPVNSAGKSADAFANGEVAWLLNNGAASPIWQQKLGTDTTPTFSGGVVRCVTFKNGETDAGAAYVNAGGRLTKPADPVDSTKTGWKVGSWCKESTFENAWNFETDTVSADMTLYARWTHVAHQEGTAATCTEKAVCSVCNEPYGEPNGHSFDAAVVKPLALKSAGTCVDEAVYYYSCSATGCGVVETGNENHVFKDKKDPKNHSDIQHIARVESDTETTGNIEYWYCKGCGKYYADAALTKEISKQETVLSTKERTYSASLPQNAHGTVAALPEVATANTQVTLTVTPDAGYKLGSLSVTDKNGREVNLTEQGKGVYTFRMPEGGVSVKAKFTAKQSASFVDVPKSAYFFDAVNWAVENDITSGTDENHFDPNGSCTRAQLVTFLWRAAGCPVVDEELSFNDVGRHDYFAEAVRWAASEGIVKGYDASTFGANDSVTREQVATILFRFAAAQGMDAVTLQELLGGYSDAQNVSGYAISAMNWAIGAGIVQGANGSLMPQSDCTRAQIVTMLYRLLG